MAGSIGIESLAGPTYISSHYADNILSDVRPIRLKLEALRCLNVLLDEFLYNILSAAGSLTTDYLKTGLNKILPTTLGKEAILEAEVELKGYWERNTPQTPIKHDFELQWSFELLRLKCEGYTTMNDTDEDSEAIRRVNDKMGVAGSLTPPHASLLAPASLYLTAILEYFCEHILSNVSRVVARDSGRTVATVQDLFVALCEDDVTYNMFKSMKVYEQIDSFSKMQHPRRSKSLSKGSMNGRASRGASPHAQADAHDGSPTLSRLRGSSESARPNVATALAQQPVSNGRGSSEKSRVRLFGRSSSDHERSEIPDLRQYNDDTRKSNSFEIMDEVAVQEFDELMKSSSTMKVSLTPDRLKSMEVYKQEKKRHKIPDSEPSLSPVDFTPAGGGRRPRHVDSILEDEEPSPLADTANAPSEPVPPSQPNSPQQNVIVPRARLTSLSSSAMPNSSPIPIPAPVARTRSVTISVPLTKKRSNAQIRVAVPPMPPNTTNFSPKRGGLPNENFPPVQGGRPQRTRKVGRNRESMDLDDVMNGGGDDGDDFGTVPTTPRSRKSTRDPSRPYISQSARDLIDFLEEGPPVELHPSMNASMVSLGSSKSKSGRLQRMMSRLTLGGSSERLNRKGSTTDDSRSAKNRRSPSNASQVSTPPSSYLPTSPPVNMMPTVVVATPPPPLSSFSTMSTMSSVHSTDTNTATVNSGSTATSTSKSNSGSVPTRSESVSNGVTSRQSMASRRISIARKAVPTWDGEIEKTEQVILIPSPSKSEKRRSKSSPLDAFPPVPDTISIDGRILPNGHVEVITEIRARRESRTPSPAVSTHTDAEPRKSSMQSMVQDISLPPAVALVREKSTTPTPPPQPGYPPPLPPLDEPAVEKTIRVLEEEPQSDGRSQTLLSEEPGTMEEVLEVVEQAQEQPQPLPEVQAEPQVAGPAFTATDAQDLRRLLSVATTADECRLLVDMFLTRSGFPLHATQDVSSSEVDATASALEDYNDTMERSLVSLLLGEGADDELEMPEPPLALHTPPALVTYNS